MVPRLRKANAPNKAWVFPDGVAARVQVRAGSALAEDRVYSATGDLYAAVFFRAGSPYEVRVPWEGAVTAVPVADWALLHDAGAALRLPQGAQLEGGEGRLSASSWRFAWAWSESPEKVGSDAFFADLSARCGCTVEDRHSVWIDGAWGVRFRAAPDEGGLAELWAIPRGDRVFMAAFSGTAAEAPIGRAIVTQLHWEKP